LKKLTPIIEKIRMNREQTRSTFFIEGRDARRAFTTNRIPSFLDITRNGLKALSALRAFKA
jgi:nucleosome binding factor SPN SPT16 subunit